MCWDMHVPTMCPQHVYICKCVWMHDLVCVSTHLHVHLSMPSSVWHTSVRVQGCARGGQMCV